MKYKYGQIVAVAAGPCKSKPGPALILQNERFTTGDSVLVVPFTSSANPEIDTRISIKPSKQNGLDRDCYLEVDKLSAICVEYIAKAIGTLESTYLEKTAQLARELVSNQLSV